MNTPDIPNQENLPKHKEPPFANPMEMDLRKELNAEEELQKLKEKERKEENNKE